TSINSLSVKDSLKPTVYGMGIKGEGQPAQINGKMQRPYVIWKDIIRRCYDEKSLALYPTYRECTVCDRWLNYQNFYEDIKHLHGYSEWVLNDPQHKMQIDKDIIKPGNKIYCPEYCKFVTATENSLDANSRPKTRRKQIH
ncbi:hypothetical protein, partial [Herbiconiux daphne]